MALHRFFAPSLDLGDETTVLPRDESQHLTRVLRLTTGDTVSVFDGRGHEFLARVVGTERREVRVQLLSRVEPAAEPSVAVTLVPAVLKGDRMDEVVRDAVMLGVAAIHPIVSKRTEATVAHIVRGTRLERWRRVALASVKQSRRATLPEVRTPLGFGDFLEEPPAAVRLMLVEPGIEWAESIGALRGSVAPPDAALMVGPEGGWTPEECAAARERGVRLVTLGHRTLRADAVPVAAVSVLQFVWSDI